MPEDKSFDFFIFFIGRGFIYGAILALVGSLLIYFTISPLMIYLCVYGGCVGMLVGGVCGVIISIVVHAYLNRLQNTLLFLAIVIVVSALSALVLTVLIVGDTHRTYAVIKVPLISRISMLGGVLAMVGAGYAGWEAGVKYLQSRETSSQSTIEQETES